jgi:hypothetical protein
MHNKFTRVFSWRIINWQKQLVSVHWKDLHSLQKLKWVTAKNSKLQHEPSKPFTDRKGMANSVIYVL